ncbi:MAG: terminase small subunit [Bacteroidales bacterium]|nr:terminase small subunit [Bacteroidales bacterium]
MAYFILKEGVALSKLTVKQEAFCLHYAKTGNATESYKQAGYSVKSDTVAGVEGHKLLKNPKVKDRLAELAEETKTAAIADIAEIQEMLTAILRNQAHEQVVVVENIGDFTSEARTVEKDTSIKDRIKAAETLAKMQGAFDNKFQLELTVPQFGGEDSLED